MEVFRACKVCTSRKKAAARRPVAAVAGTEPAKERLARARGKGRGRRARGARHGGGRGRAPEPRARRGRWRAQARRLAPPPDPTHRLYAFLPAPFFSREGRAVGLGPFASPPWRRRSAARQRGGSRGAPGLTSAALRPAAKR